MRALLILAFAFTAGVAAADEKLTDARYPEGALWHDGRLYYGEMARDVIVVWDLKTTRTFWHEAGCGPVSIAPYRKDEFLVLCHLAHHVVRVSARGETVAVIARDSAGKPFVYPNASSADAAGGVYFSSSGTFSLSTPATGAVFYLDPQGRLSRVAEGIHYANGVGVDAPRKRLIVSAHLGRQVLAFVLIAPGKLGARSVFFDFAANGIEHEYPLAGPDGLEIDAKGDVVVAEYGEGRIHKISSSGAWLGTFGGFAPFVTDMALLPDGRAAVTATFANDTPQLPGEVVLRDRFLQRFVK
jgi:sugar lactone lactonase YvrE